MSPELERLMKALYEQENSEPGELCGSVEGMQEACAAVAHRAFRAWILVRFAYSKPAM